MCMDSVTWNAKSRSNTRSAIKWLKGYKIFNDATNNKVKGPHYGTEIEIGKVVKANIDETRSTGRIKNGKYGRTGTIRVGETGGEYHAGFHIFPIKIAAKLYGNYYGSLYLVEYRKIVAEGTHPINVNYPADCHIALEMRVIKKLDPDEVAALREQEEDIKNGKPKVVGKKKYN